MISTLLLSFTLASAAEPCDAKALTAAVNDAAPIAVAGALSRLYACSPADAEKVVGPALARMIDGEGSQDALLAAVRLKAFEGLRGWISRQESGVQSRVMTRLGEACSNQPEIGEFFLNAAAADSERFWKERWHRGLSTCRTPAVQALLAAALTGPPSQNKATLQSIVEVYARNLGAAAVPTLATLLRDAKDESTATSLLVAFADAANVGGAGGINQPAADAARDAIADAAPRLTERGLDRARGTLTALGFEGAANALARFRFPDRYVDGHYTWGVTAVEHVTCKSGELREALHVGGLSEGGSTWPDGMPALADAAARARYKLDAASRCKGTGETIVTVSAEPVADLTAWVAEQKQAFTDAAGEKKTFIVDEATITP